MRRQRTFALLASTIALGVGAAFPLGVAAGTTQVVAGTSYVWVGSSQDVHADNHSWTDQRNWSPTGVPGNGDSVSIAPPDASHCVAHVDAVPTVSLDDFSLSVAGRCGASVNGGAITVSGALGWDTGVVNTPITVASTGTGLISGAAADNPRKVLEQNMTIHGTVDLAGALVQVAAPTLLTIAPDGLLRSSGIGTFTATACCVDPAHVVNKGTLDILDGTLTAQAVELDQLAHLDVAAGGVLKAVSAPVTAADGASYTGRGRFLLWNGTKTVLTGEQKLGKGFHLELGNDGGGGDTLGGTATLSGTGTLDWTGGTIMGNLTVGHSVFVHAYGANPGNGRRILSGQDTSGGGSVSAILVAEGRFVVDQGATFATAESARLVLTPDAGLSLAPGTHLTSQSCCVNPSTILNEGGVIIVPAKPRGAGPAIVDGIAYDADGGTVDVARGTELRLTGGPQGGVTAITVTGGGRLTIDDPMSVIGTQTLAGSSSLRLSTKGSIDGISEITGTGQFDWRGGSLSGDITFTNGGVAIGGDDPKTVKPKPGGSVPSEVHVEAPVVFAAAKAKHHNLLDLGSATMTLAGTTLMGAYVELNGGTLVNTGSLTMDPGAKGAILTHVGLHLVNRGQLALVSGELVSDGPYSQAAGTSMLLDGTTATFAFSSNPLSVDGGVLTGGGTVAGPVVNSGGVLDPGLPGEGPPGTLTVGAYTQATGASLHLDLSSAGRDLLAVLGAATVAGSLVSHNLAGYTPALGEKQRVMTTDGALTWSVTCATTTGTGSGSGHWQPKPAANALDLVWKSGTATGC